MKTINENEIEQGSNAWHSFRALGIGGSEVAMVLGISPYKTAYELWEIKTGLKEDNFESNFAVEKGTRLEPKIRAMYELQSGNMATPCLVIREDNEAHRASLDGRDSDKKIISEFKYVGAGDKWALALEGKAPDHYYAQMQWQLYITGDDKCDYVAYNDKENKIIIIEIFPDVTFIKSMVKEVNKFWKFVTTKKEPPLSDKDWKEIKNKELKDSVDLYKKLKLEFDKIKIEIDAVADKIKTDSNIKHPRIVCNGVKIQEITKKGSIDYKKIIDENLPGFDCSGYIKPSITYRSIKV